MEIQKGKVISVLFIDEGFQTDFFKKLLKKSAFFDGKLSI